MRTIEMNIKYKTWSVMMSLTINCIINGSSLWQIIRLYISIQTAEQGFSVRIGSYAKIINILYTYMFRKHHESIKFWSDIKHKSRVVPEFLYWALISSVEEDWAHSWFPPLIYKNSNRLPWGPKTVIISMWPTFQMKISTLKCRYSCIKSCS